MRAPSILSLSLAPVLALGLWPAPSSAQEAADPELVAAGHATYRAKCQSCHGPTATSDPGGDIRRKTFRQIRSATAGFDQMPEIPLTEDQMEAIAAFLAQVSDTE